MMFQRHKQGKVLDLSAEICPDSILDKESRLAGDGQVWQSDIRSSWIEGKVLHSLIENSKIVAGEIAMSHLRNVQFENGRCYGAYLENSKISGGLIRGNKIGVRVIDSIVQGGTIQGSAVVVGITVRDLMYLDSGTWTREPRYFEIDNELSHFGVTESTNGNAFIACTKKPIEQWIKGKFRFGKAVGWSREVLDTLEERFTEWKENPLPTY